MLLFGGFFLVVLLVALSSSLLTRYYWWQRWHWLFNGPLIVAAISCFIYGKQLDSAGGLEGLVMYFYGTVSSFLAFAGLRPVLSNKNTDDSEQADATTVLELTGGFLPDSFENREALSEISQNKPSAKAEPAWIFHSDLSLLGKRSRIALCQSRDTLQFHNVEFMSNRIPRLLAGSLGTRMSRNVAVEDIQSIEFVKVLKYPPHSGGNQLMVHLTDGYFRVREYHYRDFRQLKQRLSGLVPLTDEKRGKQDLEALSLFLCILAFLLILGTLWAFSYLFG